MGHNWKLCAEEECECPCAECDMWCTPILLGESSPEAAKDRLLEDLKQAGGEPGIRERGYA